MNINHFNIVDICKRANVSAEKVNSLLNLVQRSMKSVSKHISVVENGIRRYYTVRRDGIGILNTKYGKFWQYNFFINDKWEKYSVIVKAKIDKEVFLPVFKKTEDLVLRTDSGCETGQIYGDLTCECHEQLNLALKTIEDAGEGLLIHITHQDGRGTGTTFKLATLWLQDILKINTVESATLLSHSDDIDVRTYSGVICILKFFNIPTTCKINLMTNNPRRVKVFSENGYIVNDTPIVIKPNKYTRIHLKAKQEYLGHKGLI